MYERNCVFEEILENKSGDKKQGDGQWHSCDFRCSFKDGDYDNNVVFSSMYKPLIERVEALSGGDAIKVDFSVSANSWEKDGKTKWFPKLVALKVYKDTTGNDAL